MWNEEGGLRVVWISEKITITLVTHRPGAFVKTEHMKRLIRKVIIPALSLLVIMLPACNRTEDSNTANINGFVQKGPFVQGSSVTVFDLRNDLTQTGISFNTQINDNKGSFSLESITLSSGYITLRADGFYFNEVSGGTSKSQITLYALADANDMNNVNVNILTHLEKARVEYLIKNGKSFSEAKSQAQKEVLKIFSIEKNDITTSESLNITEEGNDNSILLAVSAIVQGFRSEGDLTELLSNISNDIREDGILNEGNLGSQLVSHALYLDTAAIRDNLIMKYQPLGINPDFGGFGAYVMNFLGQTEFDPVESIISYPQTGANGFNVLYLSGSQYASGLEKSYSLAAGLPENISLKIKLTALSADSVLIPASDSTASYLQITPKIWYYSFGSGVNWSVSTFNTSTSTQVFTSIEPGQTCDHKLHFEKGKFLIEYFEMDAVTPTRSRTIEMN